MDIVKDLFYAQQILLTLFSLTNKLQIQGDKYLEDMTIRQVPIIPIIFHAPDGKATINYIARNMGTSKQNVKQIVDAMERKGYLSVVPSDQDKRTVNVTITLGGEKAFRKCSERIDEFLANIFNSFRTEDLETICTLLQKLYCFDGIEQETFEHRKYHIDDAEEVIIQYHQNFAKLRVKANEKEFE